MFNFSKLMPSGAGAKVLMIGGALVAAVIGWRMLSGGGGSSASVVYTDGSYDPELVALGTQASLERDAMANELEIAKLQYGNTLALAGMDASTTLSLANIGAQMQASDLASTQNIAMQSLWSNERMFASDIVLQTEALRSGAALANQQQAMDYDIAKRVASDNYEAGVQERHLQHVALDYQHDIGKKNIGVQKWGMALDGAKSLVPVLA